MSDLEMVGGLLIAFLVTGSVDFAIYKLCKSAKNDKIRGILEVICGLLIEGVLALGFALAYYILRYITSLLP